MNASKVSQNVILCHHENKVVKPQYISAPVSCGMGDEGKKEVFETIRT